MVYLFVDLFEFGTAVSDHEGELGDDVLVAAINNPIGFTCNCLISNQVYVSIGRYCEFLENYGY